MPREPVGEDALDLCALVVVALLEVVLDGDDAARQQLLDLLWPVLPRLDVGRVDDPQRPAREDGRLDQALVRGLEDGLLVSAWCAGLARAHEPRAHPHGRGTVAQRRCEPPTVVNAARSDDLDLLARQWAVTAAHKVDYARDEDRRGHVARVAAGLAALRNQKVRPGVERLGDMLGMANDVGEQDPRAVQAIDDVAGRDADGGAVTVKIRVSTYQFSAMFVKDTHTNTVHLASTTTLMRSSSLPWV